MSESIWYENIYNLFSPTNYFKILPIREMTLQEKLNSLVRFFVYLGIILALINRNYKYLLLGIITALISIIINNFESKKKEETEKFLKDRDLTIVDNKICARSTVENPFMNLSVADISLNPDHPQACDIDNTQVRKTIAKNFHSHVYRDVNDIYSKDASERQFYTMPCTKVVNDQTDFGNWLYNRGSSCKEGSGEQCWRNIDGEGLRVGGGNSKSG